MDRLHSLAAPALGNFVRVGGCLSLHIGVVRFEFVTTRRGELLVQLAKGEM